MSRLCVLVFAVIAYLLARGAERVHDLVEDASAFGTGGLFVVFVVAMMTKPGSPRPFGGPRSAIAALTAGLVVWLLGRHLLDLPAPFLCSVAAAALAFVGMALMELTPRRVGP